MFILNLLSTQEKLAHFRVTECMLKYRVYGDLCAPWHFSCICNDFTQIDLDLWHACSVKTIHWQQSNHTAVCKIAIDTTNFSSYNLRRDVSPPVI
jgi:hypothetical protein